MCKMKSRSRFCAAVLVVVLCSGIIASTGSPVLADEPLPKPVAKKITADEPENGVSAVKGKAGVVPPGSKVWVMNCRTRQEVSTVAAGDGSFTVGVPAQPGDELIVFYEADGKVSYGTNIYVESTSVIEKVIDDIGGIIKIIIKVRSILDLLHQLRSDVKTDATKYLARGVNDQRLDVRITVNEPSDGLILSAFVSPLRVDLPEGVTLASPALITSTGDMVLGTVSGNVAGSSEITIPIASSGGDGNPDQLHVDMVSAGVNVAADAPLGTAYANLSHANGLIARFPADVVADETLDPSIVTNPFTIVLDPRGGSITNDLPEGIVVPENALDAETAMVFETVDPAPAQYEVPIDTYRIVVARAYSPGGLTLNTPVTIEIPYTEEEIAELSESSLRAFAYDGVRWYPVTGSALDPERKTVTFQTTVLGTYGIGGSLHPEGYSTPWAILTAVSLLLAGCYLLLGRKRTPLRRAA